MRFMDTPTILWLLYLLVALAYWLRTVYGISRLRELADLGRLSPPEPKRWPRLSIVVAARDEGAKIGAAVSTLLDVDYPDLELVIVNDRSSDRTGEIIDRFAAADDRIRPIHVTELPEGWLGKLHALQCGLKASAGELVLFTDADVHFKRETLKKAVGYLEEERLDHLAACPAIWSAGLLVDTVVAAFLRQLATVLLSPWRVRDPQSRAFFGVGAFNLIRRASLERTEGLSWLRMETGDDMGLGLLMKRSGCACDVVVANTLVGLHWHRTLRDIVRGSEKGYAIAGCSFPLMVLSGLLGCCLEISPVTGFLALTGAPAYFALPLALANLALFVISAKAVARWARGPILPALLAPLVAPLNLAIWIRAAILGWYRDGIVWRDTLYTSEWLRAGRRVRL